MDFISAGQRTERQNRNPPILALQDHYKGVNFTQTHIRISLFNVFSTVIISDSSLSPYGKMSWLNLGYMQNSARFYWKSYPVFPIFDFHQQIQDKWHLVCKTDVCIGYFINVQLLYVALDTFVICARGFEMPYCQITKELSNKCSKMGQHDWRLFCTKTYNVMFSIFIIFKTEDNLPLPTIQMLSKPDFSHPKKEKLCLVILQRDRLFKPMIFNGLNIILKQHCTHSTGKINWYFMKLQVDC